MAIHPATQGYQAAAIAYERSRPGYAPEAITVLTQELHITSGTRVVDSGAGTGKLTRQLLGTGACIIAVEPVGAMRQQFRAALPHVDLRAGSAEALPLSDGSIDVAVVGQAWHWFEAAAALRELTRVVVPGGGLTLLWYDFDDSAPEAAWVAALRAVRDHRAPVGLPDLRLGHWRRPFGSTPAWTPLHERQFRHGQQLSRDASCRAAVSPPFRFRSRTRCAKRSSPCWIARPPRRVAPTSFFPIGQSYSGPIACDWSRRSGGDDA